MSDVITVPQVRPVQPVLRFLRVVPGVILLAAIGYAGKLLEQNVGAYAKAHHWTFPNIEYVLWAIVLGLVISNTVGVPEIFRTGVATYEFWLKAGIVLLGSRFLLGDILKLGGISLVLVAIEITGSIAFMTFLGRLFRLKPKLTSLLAVGSAVCGVSAIIATKGAIEADDEDSSFSIAAILALGALALFTFPLIGHVLHLSDRAYGLWAGLAVDNTAEATAAGALYSDAASNGNLPFLQQGTGWRARQSFALGVSADFRGRRPAHQLPRNAQAGPPSLRSRRHRRSRDRRLHLGSGCRCGKALRLVTALMGDQTREQQRQPRFHRCTWHQSVCLLAREDFSRALSLR